MSAALKQKSPEPMPTPFPSPERAALAAAIAAAAEVGAGRVALEKAAQSANADVLKAIQTVEGAETALAEAQGKTLRHAVATALSVVGEYLSGDIDQRSGLSVNELPGPFPPMDQDQSMNVGGVAIA